MLEPTQMSIAGGTGVDFVRHEWSKRLTESSPRTVALADGEDPRAIEAALALHHAGDVIPMLVGDPARIAKRAQAVHGELPASLVVMDARRAGQEASVQAVINEGFAEAAPNLLRRWRTDPLHVSAALLRLGRVDAVVAGASRPTAEVLRAGLRLIGLAQSGSTMSSCFLMLPPHGEVLCYADCSVVPDPNVSQLADIAIASAYTFANLTGVVPRVAMLSFSTLGSAHHASPDKVRKATELIRIRDPHLTVDGEIQFDAACVPEIGAMKAPGSVVAGIANVFIFPNLDAANIACKITERLAGFMAIGPVLQGLSAPFNDLSRGCSAADIELLALLSAVQASTRLL